MTAKLSRIKRYSKFFLSAVGFIGGYHNQTKELLDQYQISTHPDGEEITLDNLNKAVLISGPQAGVVISSSFRAESTLERYNITLTTGNPRFVVPSNYK